MTGYLIDTDWIIDSLHGQAAATQTLLQLAPRGLAVSLISYGELYQGPTTPEIPGPRSAA